MKIRHILFAAVYSSILLISCGDDKQKKSKGLDTSLINNPRTADVPEEVATKGLATMDFADTAYDFGKMHEGESASYEFKFTNNGKAPLLISNAAGSCGCTVPDYPHEPIEPGKSATVNVKFNSTGKTGMQHKSVNIFTNSNKGTHVLNISADVAEQ